MFDSWVRKMPWRRAWQPTPVFLPEESHGWRSLAGCHPGGHRESDTHAGCQEQTTCVSGPDPAARPLDALWTQALNKRWHGPFPQPL